MRKFFHLLTLILFCAGVGKIWHLGKDGFSVQRIKPWSFEEMYSISDEAKDALKQPFYYIARGHQCYAFGSADGKFVLKLPRTDRYKAPFWSYFFKKKRREIEKDVQSREEFLIQSFKISYEDLRDETALLAFRMGSSRENLGSLLIFDKLGRKYCLPAHKTSFLLQKKMPILMREFEYALETGQKEKAVHILDSFLQAVYDRASKGILNKDPSFLKNFGYDGIKAYQIDVGSFYRKEGIGGLIAIHKAMKDTIDPVRKWLKVKDPDLVDHLNQKIEVLVRRGE